MAMQSHRAPCMIEFTEMLLKDTSKTCFADCPPALFAHTVEYPRPRTYIHKEGGCIVQGRETGEQFTFFFYLTDNHHDLKGYASLSELLIGQTEYFVATGAL